MVLPSLRTAGPRNTQSRDSVYRHGDADVSPAAAAVTSPLCILGCRSRDHGSDENDYYYLLFYLFMSDVLATPGHVGSFLSRTLRGDENIP